MEVAKLALITLFLGAALKISGIEKYDMVMEKETCV